ncbi:MAG: hypothetical protein JST59_02115 [Actinobacteria bacterium]|nr:hypothetical protein [Actinomycetota bacterium]
MALNVLGNIAVEDINYRDALMKNGVHTWVIDRVRLQLEHCACIYTEDSDLVVKRYWQFCFWYLQVLGEYAECVFEPHEIVQFAVKFIKPTFPPDIVSLCLSVLNDFSIYLEPCFAEFNEGLRVLVAELTKKEQPYSREVIHSVCYLDKLTFTELQPFCRLINPHYYSK